MIESEGIGQDAEPADQTVGGLEPGDTAQPGRCADRPAGVAAERRRQQAGRHRGAGTAARPAGEAIGFPGIAGGRPGQIEGRAAMGEFMGRQFAHQHRARRVQARRGRRVFIRHPVGARLGMSGRADAFGVVDVLQAERNAVHRAAIAPGGDFRLRRFGGRQCVIARHQQKRIQLRVQRLDPPKQRFRQLDRRQILGLDRGGHFGNGHEMKIGRHGIRSPAIREYGPFIRCPESMRRKPRRHKLPNIGRDRDQRTKRATTL